MTFKSIVENIIERESRRALEKSLDIENNLDFGTVEMQGKDNLFQNFAVTFREFGKPWEYRVIGFISENGYVTPSHYKLGSETQWNRL